MKSLDGFWWACVYP